jgi:hypothetical protein
VRFVARWPMRIAGKLRRVSVFQETELLIESLHLRRWEARRKPLLLVTFAYGFLLVMFVVCFLL